MGEQNLQAIYRESIHTLAERFVSDVRAVRLEQNRSKMADRFITAVHEAGHALVAMLLTGDVSNVQLTTDLAGHMILSDDICPLDIDEPPATRFLNNAAISAAGCLTVAMATYRQPGVTDPVVVGFAMHGANDDRETIEMVWGEIRRDWNGTRESFVRAAHERAYALLSSNWQSVELIASELVARGTVNSAQLRSIARRLQDHGWPRSTGKARRGI